MSTGLIPFGGEFQINTYTTSIQYEPSVTALADGGFVVTWTSDGQHIPSIFGQRFDASGAPVGAEFQLNPYGFFQDSPSVTALADGGFVVTWVSNGRDGWSDGIFGQRFDASGAPMGADFQVNTYTQISQDEPSVAALADGGFVVTWTSFGQDGNGEGIFGQRYDASGAPVGAEFQVNSYTTGHQRSPSVTALADGGFVVTWTSDGQDGSGNGIFGQRYDASGAPAAAEFQVNSYRSGTQAWPSVTALADGGFVVTWTSDGQDGSGNGIFGQRFDASGAPVGAEFQVNSYTQSDQVWPSVAALADGGFVVTWQSRFQDGNGQGIFGQFFDANGTPVGAEFQVNTYTTGPQESPSLTSLADGGVVITWQSWAQAWQHWSPPDGIGNGIFGQRFVPPILGTPGDDSLTGSADMDCFDGLAGNDTIAGMAGRDALLGGAGDDSLIGGDGADTLDGGAGADTLEGGAGDDTYLVDDAGDVVLEAAGGGHDLVTALVGHTLSAGVEDLTVVASTYAAGIGNGLSNRITAGDAGSGLQGLGGDDTLVGGDRADWLAGGDGADSLYGNGGDDGGAGGAGNDGLLGGAGSDGLWGGAGDDVLDGGTGADVLGGGDGADEILGGNGNDTLYGSDGADTLYGGDGVNMLWAGEGDDEIHGGAGRDAIRAGPGEDTVWAGDGDDLVLGRGGADMLSGENGADRLWGEAEDDTVSGDAGHDMLGGGDGDDALSGGTGNDVIYGGAGMDIIDGGDGDDVIFGGAGSDTIDGGAGDDALWCWSGADRIEFQLGSGSDEVIGFDAGEDRLALSDALWGGGKTPAQIVADHATVTAQGVLLDFGADTILLTGSLTLQGLEGALDIL